MRMAKARLAPMAPLVSCCSAWHFSVLLCRSLVPRGIPRLLISCSALRRHQLFEHGRGSQRERQAPQDAAALVALLRCRVSYPSLFLHWSLRSCALRAIGSTELVQCLIVVVISSNNSILCSSFITAHFSSSHSYSLLFSCSAAPSARPQSSSRTSSCSWRCALRLTSH